MMDGCGFFFSLIKNEIGWMVEKLSPKSKQIKNEAKSLRLTVFFAKRRGRDNESFDYFIKSM